MTSSYVFDSFLPYLESIQLSRGVSGLLRLQNDIARDTPRHISQQLYTRTYFNLSAIFPQLADPSENNQRLKQILESQLLHAPATDSDFAVADHQAVRQLLDALSPVEWQELRRTHHVSKTGVEEFTQQSLGMLQKLSAPLSPGTSLLEDLILEAVGQAADKKRLARYIEVWEQAKMAHEGYPPYFDRLTSRVVQVMRSLDSKFQLPALGSRHNQVLSPRRVALARQIIKNGQDCLPHIFTEQTSALLLGALGDSQK